MSEVAFLRKDPIPRMYSLLFLGVASFVLSLFLTPVVRNIFLALDVVDRPDQGRKLHSRPIVRVGGVAIALSYTLAFGFLLIGNLKGEQSSGEHSL